MKLDLVYRNTTTARTPSRAFVASVAQVALPYLKVPKGYTAEVAVTIVGPAKIRALNKKWRKVDKPTDVLAFPLPTPKIAGYTAVSLGDLFVCPAVVAKKAKEWGRPMQYQLKWSVIHGLLHLAGYDHERGAAAAKKMSAIEQKILKK